MSRTVLLKAESTRRFNEIAAALVLHFQPRNALENSLVQTMTAARWRLLRLWGIQTVGFELEMARQDPSAGPAPVRAALAFRSLADNTRVLALENRLEATYDRQYNRALTMLLKLREIPDSNLGSISAPIDPPLELATATWDDDFQNEANLDGESKRSLFVLNELR